MEEIERSVRDTCFLQAELEAWITVKTEPSQRPDPTVQMALRHYSPMLLLYYHTSKGQKEMQAG